jgi:plastocyanin
MAIGRTIVAGIALSAVAAGMAGAAPIPLSGSVGPGHTIELRLGGKQVTRLKAGAYRLTVNDRSEDHDFRLVGPGVNRVVTGEEFVGRRTVVLTLRRGTYRFYCAPHADEMRGSFRVVG